MTRSTLKLGSYSDSSQPFSPSFNSNQSGAHLKTKRDIPMEPPGGFIAPHPLGFCGITPEPLPISAYILNT